jgi:hypothetical protein
VHETLPLSKKNAHRSIALATLVLVAMGTIGAMGGSESAFEGAVVLPLAGLLGLLLVTLRLEATVPKHPDSSSSPGQRRGADQAQSRETR